MSTSKGVGWADTGMHCPLMHLGCSAAPAGASQQAGRAAAALTSAQASCFATVALCTLPSRCTHLGGSAAPAGACWRAGHAAAGPFPVQPAAPTTGSAAQSGWPAVGVAGVRHPPGHCRPAGARRAGKLLVLCCRAACTGSAGRAPARPPQCSPARSHLEKDHESHSHGCISRWKVAGARLSCSYSRIRGLRAGTAHIARLRTQLGICSREQHPPPTLACRAGEQQARCRQQPCTGPLGRAPAAAL